MQLFGGWNWRCNAGQPLLNCALQSRFDILAGEASKPLYEFIYLRRTDVHGQPDFNKLRIIPRREAPVTLMYGDPRTPAELQRLLT